MALRLDTYRAIDGLALALAVAVGGVVATDGSYLRSSGPVARPDEQPGHDRAPARDVISPL